MTNLPVRNQPNNTWEHYEVWQHIYDLLEALPNYFKSDVLIKGINVTDIPCNNTARETAAVGGGDKGSSDGQRIFDDDVRCVRGAAVTVIDRIGESLSRFDGCRGAL